MQQWFYSKIVTLRQHRTERSIGVVRVRDSMQTYIGDWQQLQSLAVDAPIVAVFAHGARVVCKWSALKPIERQHMVFAGSTGAGAEESSEAIVSVLKINRLISFGLVLPQTHPLLVYQPCEARLYLAQHPPVLRHLLQQPCSILQWRHSVPLATVVFDGHNFTATNVSKIKTEFCDRHVEKFRCLFDTALGSNVRQLTVHLVQGDTIWCSHLELHSATTSLVQSRATSAALCHAFKVPTDVVIRRCNGGLCEWLEANGEPDDVVLVDGATSRDRVALGSYYNQANEKFFNLLLDANRQPNMAIFSDTQVLEAMKKLQTMCDDYCKQAENKHCNGLVVQFDQLPGLLFHVPSLFFSLLKPQRQ